MLTSLLPGVREVRTPLAVGYLWLLVGWLIWGDLVPLTRPPGDGLVPRLFELGTLLGSAVVLAALSFAAYAVGAILTFPVEGGLAGTLLRSLAPQTRERAADGTTAERPTRLQRLFSSDDELETRRRFQSLVRDLARRARTAEQQLGLRPGSVITDYEEPSASDLRVRLLMASTELYGEYDRLTAEGSFRINVVPALAAAVTAVSYRVGNAWLLPFLIPVAILAVQGVNRLRFARLVLWRSVTTGKVDIPAAATVEGLEERVRAAGAETTGAPSAD